MLSRQAIFLRGMIMRRETFISGVASSAVAVALVALVYGIDSRRSSSTVEPSLGEAGQAQQTSTATELNESTVVVPPRPSDGTPSQTVTEAPSDTGFGDESAARATPRGRRTPLDDENTHREAWREEATQAVRDSYALLLEDLDLTAREKDALLALLIEIQVAGATTPYTHGRSMNEHERSDRIATIIGDGKLQEFLALERSVAAYAEVQKIGAVLRQNDAPLTGTQREGLLKILVQMRDEYPAPALDNSIESLERALAQKDEYQRHVTELAPSVLSPNQVTYMFEQYQYMSYQRATALEVQKQWRADHPGEEGLPLFRPADY